MAQLKSTTVTGSLNVSEKVITPWISISKLYAPSTNGGSSLTAGSANQYLMSNGTTIYWASLPNVLGGTYPSSNTTANFLRGDGTWSHILQADTIPTSMNLSSSSMVIGTDIRELHIVNGAGGSGTDVNTGWVGGITFGAASNAASGGIYAQSSGSYGTRLYFATTDSFAQGAKARMMIQSNGRVGINTLTPSNYLSVVGNIDAKMFISNQHSSGTTTKSLEIISTISGKPIDYWWGIGSGNTNHGLYDENSTNTGDEKWILLADTTNNTWRYNGQIQLKAHTSDTTAAKTYPIWFSSSSSGNHRPRAVSGAHLYENKNGTMRCLVLGSSTVKGGLTLFNNGYYVDLWPLDTLSANRAIRLQNGDGTLAFLTDAELVKQTAITDNAEHAILVKNSTGTNNNNELAAVKYGATTNKLATVNPSTGAITAPTFQVTSNAVITYNATAGCLEITT